jgi:hypothetical protein
MLNYIKKILKIYDFKNILKIMLIFCFIVILVDQYNLLSFIINKGLLNLLVIIILIISIEFLNKNNINLIFNKVIDSFDEVILTFFISSIMLLLYVCFFDYQKYKIMLLMIFIFILLLVMILRIFKTNFKIEQNKTNVFDLQDLCQNKISLNSGDVLFLEEKEVDYDLLQRSDVINRLYNAIIKCNPTNSFTIGLNGSWGSGKTTVINNALRIISDNHIEGQYLIVKFDPWKYESEKAILKGLLEEILLSINVNFEFENIDELIDSFISVVFSDNCSLIYKIFNKELKNIKNKEKIETLVNNYLKVNNKKMILIVDNLDRIDENKASFLIQSINTIVKFENTIYILLYDEKIIEAILDDKYHSTNKYMEKVVQLKIDLPEIDVSAIENIKQRIGENLTINGIDLSSIMENKTLKFNSIREFKRYFNLMISSFSKDTIGLNINDISNLEYIKNVNPTLYYEIWNNKTFFISDDRQFDINIYTLGYDKLNKDSKEYFKKLFENELNLNLKDTLCEMFKTVKNYFNGVDCFPAVPNEKDYKDGVIDRRIYNERYFDLYFTKNENDFIRINNDVEKMINSLNNDKYETAFKKLEKLIVEYNPDELKIFMEVTDFEIYKIKEEKKYDSIKAFYDLSKYMFTRPIWFGLDSYERDAIIISNLLLGLNKSEYLEFINYIKRDYRNLRFISEIKYWIENSKSKNSEYLDLIKNSLNDLCKDVLKKRINIYDSKDYYQGNVWALSQYDNDKTKEYLLKIINDKNVFRLLNDIITNSVGTNGYGYFINKKNFDMLTTENFIDNVIPKDNSNLTSDQILIKEVYDLYKSSNNNSRNSIDKQEYIDIKNI